mmetsp:Transcript_1128/g.4577  ORF Transcript_1128/g.4577 Transcript_1128/m.4577 type:complete len:287 (-) Transcript_1128:10283-11143(-)
MEHHGEKVHEGEQCHHGVARHDEDNDSPLQILRGRLREERCVEEETAEEDREVAQSPEDLHHVEARVLVRARKEHGGRREEQHDHHQYDLLDSVPQQHVDRHDPKLAHNGHDLKHVVLRLVPPEEESKQLRGSLQLAHVLRVPDALPVAQDEAVAVQDGNEEHDHADGVHDRPHHRQRHHAHVPVPLAGRVPVKALDAGKLAHVPLAVILEAVEVEHYGLAHIEVAPAQEEQESRKAFAHECMHLALIEPVEKALREAHPHLEVLLVPEVVLDGGKVGHLEEIGER